PLLFRRQTLLSSVVAHAPQLSNQYGVGIPRAHSRGLPQNRRQARCLAQPGCRQIASGSLAAWNFPRAWDRRGRFGWKQLSSTRAQSREDNNSLGPIFRSYIRLDDSRENEGSGGPRSREERSRHVLAFYLRWARPPRFHSVSHGSCS